jgi:site-specific DNA-methyltransferase (adenine-specific)
MAKATDCIDTIITGDCVAWLNACDCKKPFADLIFADPPFNIGYKYDLYKDRRKYEEYRDWTELWMRACHRVLKPTGSFWVAIGDDYAAEVRLIGRELGLKLRNWVIWHYTFGQNTKGKFALSHTHLFYFTKQSTGFVFNMDAVAVFSDRQKEYKDKRAYPLGKVPFDVWTDFPRVCGTFSEREVWHPCQMPEGVLARITRACSNPGDLVLDPFAGSGTTPVVAKKLLRRYLGIELSPEYVAGIKKRLNRTDNFLPSTLRRKHDWPEAHVEQLRSLYVENGIPSDRLRNNPYLWGTFVRQFNERMENLGPPDGYEADDIWRYLERVRKAGKLGRVRIHAPVDTKSDVLEPPPLFGGGVQHTKKVTK